MLDKKLLFLMMVQTLCISMDIQTSRMISPSVLAVASVVPDHVLPDYPDVLQSMAHGLVYYEYGLEAKPKWMSAWKIGG